LRFFGENPVFFMKVNVECFKKRKYKWLLVSIPKTGCGDQENFWFKPTSLLLMLSVLSMSKKGSKKSN
jgi:hypothetical protein